MSFKDTRRVVLLAASIAALLREEAASEPTHGGVWARAQGAGGASWNPRRTGTSWRLDARLRQHRQRSPGTQ